MIKETKISNEKYKKACVNCIYFEYRSHSRYYSSSCKKLNKLFNTHQFSGLFCRFYKNKYKGDNNGKNKQY